MSIFTRKKQFTIKDFCKDFYDNQILNPKAGEVNASEVLSKVAKKNIVELYPDFETVSLQNLHKELTILRFELFALAWTHKFVSGKNIVLQSAFTSKYLKEKGEIDILKGMADYNNMIDGVTLHWLTRQGKMNFSFNYNTREDLTKQNDKEAKELELEPDEMANHRLWSENAWRQNMILEGLTGMLCNRLGVNPKKLNKEAAIGLAAVIKGFYDGAKQAINKVKIVS